MKAVVGFGACVVVIALISVVPTLSPLAVHAHVVRTPSTTTPMLLTGVTQPIETNHEVPTIAPTVVSETANQPSGCPVVAEHVVMTQGYGVGSHAPVEVWGAVDLAVDGDGDGQADPNGSLGAPLRATMPGLVHLTANSYPAGNHIWVIGDQYKTGYSHLLAFEVQDGQYVQRGDIIGRLGSTGESSGPHLDYQIWRDGVNQNPLDPAYALGCWN